MSRRTATRALATPEVAERVLYAPRSYQLAAINAWEAGAQRLAWVWHRQAGKDQTAIEVARRAMFGGLKRPPRPGLYLHIFPTYSQGRDALWNATSLGKRNLDVFPREFLARDPNETEMQMRFKVPGGEAIWQVMGGDKPDALRGLRPMGVVLSEYAEMDPGVEKVLDPALASTDGWVVYAFTPKGRNHGWELYQFARTEVASGNPRWYLDVQTIDQTRKDGPFEDGEVVTPISYVDEQRRRGYTEEFVQQEYWCSFDASLVGSYYGAALREAERQGRVRQVPHDPSLPVVTAWDLGVGDRTAIWFVQCVGREVRVVDFYEHEGQDITHYIRVVKEQRPYNYGAHYAPHDVQHRHLTGSTVLETARRFGLKFTVVPKLSVADGIDQVRRLLARCFFDVTACARGLEHLAAYRKSGDPRQGFTDAPFHDREGHSDAADAFRYLAVGLRGGGGEVDGFGRRIAKRRVETAMSWSPWDYERETARRAARAWSPMDYERGA